MITTDSFSGALRQRSARRLALRFARRLSRRRIAAGLTALVVVLIGWFLGASRTGAIPYHGQSLRVPLRLGSMPLRIAEGRARFLLPGSVDIKPLLVERGPDFGWRFGEQLGAMVTLESTRGDNLRMVLITEAVMSRFVEVDCRVLDDSAPPGTK